MTMYVYTAPGQFPLSTPPRPRRAAEIRPERGGGRTLPRQRFRLFSCRGRDLGRFPAAVELCRDRDLCRFLAAAENL